MLLDGHADWAPYARISEAKMQDKNFLQYLHVPAHGMIVFNKADNHYLQFAKWTEQHINFVCRLKDNMVYLNRTITFNGFESENRNKKSLFKQLYNYKNTLK